jgi:hypothetical protein
MNQEALFSDSDLLPNAQYSRNVQFIIDLIRQYSLVHLDFLACQTLLDERWKQFYSILHLETGVIVGASDNNTGNLKYGGDWIMESTQEDVSEIYFNDTIVNFAKVLTTLTITGTSVADGAYYSNNTITSVIIGTTVTSIGAAAFQYCNKLKDIACLLPSSVTSIRIDAFKGTSLLTTINLHQIQINCLLGSGLFNGCGYLTNIQITNNFTIPSTVYFFSGTSITSFNFPTSVTAIGDRMFQYCNSLTKIIIPSSVKSIGTSAFGECVSLSLVVIPSSVTSIVGAAFYNTGTNIRLFRNELTNNTYYEYIGTIPAPLSRNFFNTLFFSWSLTSTLWSKLTDSLTVNKTIVNQGESFTVTFTANSQLTTILGPTQLTYTITGVTSEELSNAQLSETVDTGTTRTFTVAKNVAKTITITSGGTFQTVVIKFKLPRKLGIGMKTRLQQFF